MGTLVVLRHGQTEFNVQNRITGQWDIPLTDEGVDQARTAGGSLAGVVFDRAYSSTLSRAFNTAAVLLDYSGSNTHLLDADGSWRIARHADIIDTHSGDFTGRVKTDSAVQDFRRAHKRGGPGGESKDDVMRRVRRFYDVEIRPRLARDEKVLVVCHAAIVKAFGVILAEEGLPVSSDNKDVLNIANATPNVVEYSMGKPISLKSTA